MAWTLGELDSAVEAQFRSGVKTLALVGRQLRVLKTFRDLTAQDLLDSGERLVAAGAIKMDDPSRVPNKANGLYWLTRIYKHTGG